MRIIRTIPSRVRKFPVLSSAADLVEGALLMKGATAATNQSVLIKATGAAAAAVGLLAGARTYSAVGDADPAAATTWPLSEVLPILPGAEVAAEYDQATVLTVTSATSTQINIGSLQDGIHGSWVYVVSGTGAGQLGYCTASAPGNVTLKSALTTTLDSTSRVVVIRPQFYAAHTLSSDASKIITSAADGTLAWKVLRNEYRCRGEEGWTELDPSKHHNKQFGSGSASLSPIFRAVFAVPSASIYNA